MNHKQKIGYTLLGASIMLIGMWIGSLVSPPVTAQSNPGLDLSDSVFDEIVCKKLKVVDSEGTTTILMSTTEHGGRVDVLNNQGENRATMGQ